MASLTNETPNPRGPAADPKYPSCLAEGNPYNFPPQLLEAGKLEPIITHKRVYFFGYEDKDPHICLQQWFPAPFTAPRNPYNGDNTLVEFPTTEHYMMYHKALLMNDTDVAAKILAPENSHPSRAKALGREVSNFDLEVWKKEADRVVEDGNFAKFGQSEELKAILLGTGDRELVEASPDDKIWGIGFKGDEGEGKENEWGNNGLGKALMKARERLRKGERSEGASDLL